MEPESEMEYQTGQNQTAFWFKTTPLGQVCTCCVLHYVTVSLQVSLVLLLYDVHLKLPDISKAVQ